MFFPLHDENPTEIRPYFTFGLIAICSLCGSLSRKEVRPQSLMQSVCVVLFKLFARPQLVNAKRAGVQLWPSEIPHRGWW